MSKKHKYHESLITVTDECSYYENLNKLMECCKKCNLQCFFDTRFSQSNKKKCKLDIENQNEKPLYAIFAYTKNIFELVDKTTPGRSTDAVCLTMDDIIKRITQNHTGYEKERGGNL